MKRITKGDKNMEEDLKFAALIRVSTEAQANRGESLSTQRKQLEDAIRGMNGTVYKWYSGPEHATPDQDRQILEDLLNDARQRKFDAVIVTDTSRWSRDSKKNAEYIEILKQNGIRFFTRIQEYDLYDPSHELFLTIGIAMNQFYAKEQNGKSTDNRIEIALSGCPSCGKKPWGRIFHKTDKKIGVWAIDEDKQKMIEEIARLYLEEGLSFADLQKRFNMNGSNIHKILTKRCGDVWIQRFKKKIRGEVVVTECATKVPRLLPEKTIQAIKDKCEARRTWDHGPSKYKYLFNRIIFDQETGYALSGTPNSKGQRYYKTYKESRNQYMLNAAILEISVTETLFEALGRNEIIYKAVFDGNDSMKNNEKFKKKIAVKTKELERVEKQLSKVSQIVDRLSGEEIPFFLEKETSKLRDLEKERSDLKFEIGAMTNELQCSPTREEIEAKREQVNRDIARAIEYTHFENGGAFEDLLFEDKQRIMKLIFGGKDEMGKRYGIYIEPIPGTPKKYSYEAYGRLGKIYGLLESRTGECDSQDLYRSISTSEDEYLLGKISTIAKDSGRLYYPHLGEDKTTYASLTSAIPSVMPLSRRHS
jgi:DNA invertase Pin-like site-specific DNA recombinase